MLRALTSLEAGGEGLSEESVASPGPLMIREFVRQPPAPATVPVNFTLSIRGMGRPD